MFAFDRVAVRLIRSLRTHARILGISAITLLLALAIDVLIHHGHAAASDSGPLATNIVRSASDSNWRQSPTSTLASPGNNSVTLDSCPAGVLASEPAYFVYISGSGTPEAVRVTGGTCKGDGHPGTLEFTTKNSHPAGYVVGTASGGIQEASIAARYVPLKQGPQSGKVVVPPGEYDVFATISIHASNQTVDFSGATLNCYTPDDPCIFVGDTKSVNDFANITLVNPRGRPMTTAGTKPFIEVNGEQTRIFNVSMRWPPKGGSFGSFVQVDDDQAFLLDGLDTALGGGGVTCNPAFCGAVISAPGPFNHWSAVGWLKNLNLSLQCGGKGIEWISGNGLKVSDSVIQGWSVFGIRVSNHRGGYAGLMTDNVYFEASPGCRQYSPYGNVGSAAIIAEGIQVKVSGLNANSPSGSFPNWGGESGSHHWLYWVVPVHEKFGEGIPLPAGQALNNGSGTIKGTFPKIAGASSYKILKIDWDGGAPRPFPEGTGDYLLTTVAQSSCATLTCSFIDDGQALTLYTNLGENFAAHIYMPRLDFWPGGVVISPAEDMSSVQYAISPIPLQADTIGVGGIVTTQPAWAVAAEASTMFGSAATPPAAANVEALHTNGLSSFPGATILNQSNLPQQFQTGHKGRLNFGFAGRPAAFTPVITLGDSNWGKTWATSGHRPKADVNDLDLGYEGNIDTFYSRAQNEVREYIGKFPDGKPQEALTSSAKTFNVPVTVNGNFTVTGKCVGCGGTSAGMRSVSLTGQKAAIAPTSLCPASACGEGQYRISYYIDSTAQCGSAGNAAATVSLSWKDEAGAKSIRLPLSGNGVNGATSLALGSTANFASGSFSLWSSGTAPITYSTSLTGCAAGAASYGLHLTAERVQ